MKCLWVNKHCSTAALPHLLLGLGGFLCTSGLPLQLFMLPQSASGLLSPWHTAHTMLRLESQHYNLGCSHHPAERQRKPQRSRNPTRTKSRMVPSMQEATAAPEVLWRWGIHIFAGICHVKSNAPQDHTQ